MKIKGRLKDISTDWQTQQTHITFTATEKSDMNPLKILKMICWTLLYKSTGRSAALAQTLSYGNALEILRQP